MGKSNKDIVEKWEVKTVGELREAVADARDDVPVGDSLGLPLELIKRVDQATGNLEIEVH